MREHNDQKKHLAKYLLGDLPENEQVELEEKYFHDDEVLTALLALEDEMMYDCLNGDLAPSERVKFQERFLATEQGKKKAQFARILLKKIENPPIVRFGPKSYLLQAIAACFLFVAVGWLLFQTIFLRTEMKRLAANSPKPPVTSIGQDQKPPVTLRFLLNSGNVRDAGSMKKLLLPPAADLIELTLDSKMDEPYQAFRVQIRNAEGAEIWSQHLVMSAKDSRVSVSVPRKILSEDDYELSLSGGSEGNDFEDIADFYFSVRLRD